MAVLSSLRPVFVFLNSVFPKVALKLVPRLKAVGPEGSSLVP